MKPNEIIPAILRALFNNFLTAVFVLFGAIMICMVIIAMLTESRIEKCEKVRPCPDDMVMNYHPQFGCMCTWRKLKTGPESSR